MTASIILIGGPDDGRTYPIPEGRPPMIWYVPVPEPLLLDLGGSFAPAPIRVAEYQQLLEYGLPSRADNGAYRYQYLRTSAPPHYGQTQPTPTLDELAAMTRDPSPAAYPDYRSHLLACRTRHSLRRDARLTGQERAAVEPVMLAWLLAERHGDA